MRREIGIGTCVLLLGQAWASFLNPQGFILSLLFSECCLEVCDFVFSCYHFFPLKWQLVVIFVVACPLMPDVSVDFWSGSYLLLFYSSNVIPSLCIPSFCKGTKLIALLLCVASLFDVWYCKMMLILLCIGVGGVLWFMLFEARMLCLHICIIMFYASWNTVIYVNSLGLLLVLWSLFKT